MQLHHTGEVAADGGSYVEFLRNANVSVGVYRLPVGANDPQEPHAEDEVYVIISGRCRFRAGEDDVPVGPGAVIFVPAHERHHFYQVTEPLQVVVLFSPPEGTRK